MQFFAVFKDRVHDEHMKHAPDAPFLGDYLKGTTVDQNDTQMTSKIKMTRQATSGQGVQAVSRDTRGEHTDCVVVL